MSSLIKKNYKQILIAFAIICLLPLFPLCCEIVFKAGNLVGSSIRYLTSCPI